MELKNARPWWCRSRGRMPTMLAATALALATVPLAAGPAEAVVGRAAVFGPQGFPQWYEDADGQRMELCLDGPRCSTVSALLNPAAGGEAVYWGAVAAPPAQLAGQGLEMEVSAGYDPTSGRPLVTGRIRIRVRGLVPGEQYTLTHPYGVEANVTAELDPDPFDPGEEQDGRIRFIEEVGCVAPEEPVDGSPAPPAPPCNFDSPLAGPLFDGFLRQPTAPPGFLGEGMLALTPRPVENGPNGNSFQVEGPGIPVGAPPTTDFLVEGRLAAPVAATVQNGTEFGTQKVGIAATKTVRVTNTGTEPVTLDEPVVAGTNPGQFAVAPDATNGCATNSSLAAGSTCRLRLTFRPSGTGFRTATLLTPNSDDADNLVRALTITGVGARPRASMRRTLAFGDVAIGRRKVLPLRVSNPGNVNLVVDSVRRSGSREFRVNATGCTGRPVRARRSCVIDVAYRPRARGRDGAALVITHDAPGSPTTVALSARGVSG
jgi:Abnormal spindle-like microcephaly-assoc'd, ASPM-SPD-2-Hydin